MRVKKEALDNCTSGLEFKLRLENDNSVTYSINKNGDYQGVISFRDYGYSSNTSDSNINVIGLFLNKIKTGLGTEILDIICKCGEYLKASNVVIWHPDTERITRYDSKGKKRI